MSLSETLDLLNRLDVPTLAVGMLYGFWKVISMLSKMEREIFEQMHAQELRLVKLEVSKGK